MLALVPTGCALFTCRPVSIVVVGKDERVHLVVVPVGIRTTELGRLEEVEQFRLVRSYWLRSKEGHWYSVSADGFEAAQVGDRIEVCR